MVVVMTMDHHIEMLVGYRKQPSMKATEWKERRILERGNFFWRSQTTNRVLGNRKPNAPDKDSEETLTEDNNGAKNKAKEEPLVAAVLAEDAGRSNRTPEDADLSAMSSLGNRDSRRSVEGHLAEAVKLEGSVLKVTDVLEAHLEVENGSSDERVDGSRPQLDGKGRTGADLGVVTELEVHRETNGLHGSAGKGSDVLTLAAVT
jgi:hypothetical protein